ncbi:hypothetical protein TIFTF001_015005 [Ficus carica]|uniref:Uncharacterized protein n=1 Tax=Ficus carica TaxID=3494 RepID=A0AA88D7G7_FICCA|nr:hypothetical protein TIFTF001_015005 [Ficus carica]
MRKAPPTENPHPQLRFYLSGDDGGDEDDFRDGDGDGDGDDKAFPSPTSSHCYP